MEAENCGHNNSIIGRCIQKFDSRAFTLWTSCEEPQSLLYRVLCRGNCSTESSDRGSDVPMFTELKELPVDVTLLEIGWLWMNLIYICNWHPAAWHLLLCCLGTAESSRHSFKMFYSCSLDQWLSVGGLRFFAGLVLWTFCSGVEWSGGKAPDVNLGTRWKRVFSFMLWLLYPWYFLEMKPSWPQKVVCRECDPNSSTSCQSLHRLSYCGFSSHICDRFAARILFICVFFCVCVFKGIVVPVAELSMMQRRRVQGFECNSTSS
jgi:hypothetical protein